MITYKSSNENLSSMLHNVMSQDCRSKFGFCSLIQLFRWPTCMLPKGLPPPIDPGIKPPKLPVMPSVRSESWDIIIPH